MWLGHVSVRVLPLVVNSSRERTSPVRLQFLDKAAYAVILPARLLSRCYLFSAALFTFTAERGLLKMSMVRLAVVGTGGMGMGHIKCILEVPQAELVAVCDVNPESARRVGELHKVPWYTDHRALLDKEKVDGVHVCTPHPAHPEPTIDALSRGVHVLCEKPLAATIEDAERMVQAARRGKAILAVMYQQRTSARNRKVREILSSGALGELVRISLVAAGFRTQAYYGSAPWRGTWKDEGGGVVINQSPHALDLFQWFVGMPEQVYACTDTLLHRMQTEDIASIVVRFPSGAHGTIHLSVNEAPGTHRWEIAGTAGKLVLDDTLRVARLKTPIREFLSTCTEPWSAPEATWEEVAVEKTPEGHHLVVENFCRAILGEAEPLVTGEDGLKSQELINAILMSGMLHRPVNIPIDRKEYTALLRKKVQESG